ncbi:Small subunit (SSU) processome component [Agyrium rufum]|nr:Small subunit (SSU) processome component [Agyrium rufum]
MGKKQSGPRAVPKVSSAAAINLSSSSQTSYGSSILRSSFAPSQYQLSLFAAVLQSLDSQHLQVYNANTSKLQCDHSIGPKTSITCLEWGRYPRRGPTKSIEPSRKRRKTASGKNTSNVEDSDVVIAYGTGGTKLQFYSPAEARIIDTLDLEHEQGIRDFKFAEFEGSLEGWSLGGDGKLKQWNLRKHANIRSIQVSVSNPTVLLPTPSSIFCASHDIELLDRTTGEIVHTLQGFSQNVHTMVYPSRGHPDAESKVLAAAESENYILVFNIQTAQIIGTLTCESEVIAVNFQPSVSNGHNATQRKDYLAAITKDGLVEIFSDPFSFDLEAKSSQSLKEKRKRMTRRANTRLRLVRPEGKSGSRTLPIISASLEGSRILVAWPESATDVSFDSIPLVNEDLGTLLNQGIFEIVKPRAGKATQKSALKAGQSQVDESHLIVTNADTATGTDNQAVRDEIIEVSSGVEDSDSDEELEQAGPVSEALANGASHVDSEMQDADKKDNEDGASQEPAEEPSFGDLIRANAREEIAVPTSLAASDDKAVEPFEERRIQPQSNASLGTVLTQALHTNDNNLLETCLHVKDFNMVRATIERLHPSAATTLLQKLAERLHSRPGRAGTLMVWVQWTLIAHGGYIASQPTVVKKLTQLYKVVRERASSLPSLLQLKGKLDMLEAQLNIRRSVQTRSKSRFADDESDEDDVVYVEGENYESSSVEGSDDGIPKSSADTKAKAEAIDRLPNGITLGESDEEVEDPDVVDASGSDISSSAEDSNPLFDQEAEETDADTGDESVDEEVDFDDVDSVDEEDMEGSNEEEEEDAAPPAKPVGETKLTNGIKTKKRK